MMSNALFRRTLPVAWLVALVAGATADAQALRQRDRASKHATAWLWLSRTDSAHAVSASVTGDLDRGQEITVTTPGIMVTRVPAPDGSVYDRLTVDGGAAAATEAGHPEMPFAAFYVEIPHGVDVSLDITHQRAESLGTGYLVYPGQPDHLANEPPAPFTRDRRAYDLNRFVPESPVSIVRTGVLRGRRVALVRVFPARYDPATSELQAFRSIRFRLVFSGDIDDAAAADRARLANEDWERQARGLILNYEPVAPRGHGPANSGSTRTYGGDYLIIVADQLYDAVVPLAEWKRKDGFVTRVVRAMDIYDRPGPVPPSAIYQFIHTAYTTWDPPPAFVLLVGDDRGLSVATLPLGDVGDLPYAMMDDPWLPDLAIGRLPVDTVAECRTVVDKILRYERSPEPGDWCRSMLAASHFEASAASQNVEYAHHTETVMTVYQFLVNSLGWIGATALRAPADTWDPNDDWHWVQTFGSNTHLLEVREHHWGSIYPDPVPQWIVDRWETLSDTRASLSAAVDAGVGLIVYQGHGGPSIWSSLNYGEPDVDALRNGAKTPAVFTVACQTADFTQDNCVAVKWLTHPAGGGVAYFGSTMIVHAQNGIELLYGMLAGLWPAFDPAHVDRTYPVSTRLGEAMNFGICYKHLYYAAALDEVKSFVLLGDPGMMLRTDRPRRLRAEYPARFPRGTPADLRVRVFDGESPVAGARVTLSRPNYNDIRTAHTDSRGVCVLGDVQAPYPEPYDLVVTAHNYVAHETTVGAADVLVVRPDGTSPYRSIQSAIDAADDWDLVELAPGTYTGVGNTGVSFRGKRITVRSQTGDPADCVIDCRGERRGFEFSGGEDDFAVLEGVTIINGAGLGGGILCVDSSPTIKRCRILGNATDSHGGGIACVRGAARIYGCLLSGNAARGRGTGGAIYCEQAAPRIVGGTIVGNTTDGVGCALHCADGSEPELVDTILWDNTSAAAGGAVFCDRSSSASLDYCVLREREVIGYGGIRWGKGNLRSDPQLIDANGPDGVPGTPDDDPRPGPLSPCIDAGSYRQPMPELPIDLDGGLRVVNGRVDIGAFERQ